LSTLVVSELLPSGVKTLDALFDTSGQKYPDRTARSFFSGESMTYQDLAHIGRRAARGLVAAGVRPGDPVAVQLRSPVQLLQAIHAVTVAGAAVMPLPVSVGPPTVTHLSRLRHVLEDSGTVHVIVEESSAEAFTDLMPTLRPLVLSGLLTEAGEGALPVVNENDLAVIQYTSGSTSDPRGVALTHRNVLAGIRALHRGTEARPGDVLGHWLPLSHDMGLFSTLGAVAAGMDVRISTPWDFIKHPDVWLERFCEFGATILVGPNFSYQQLIDAVAPGQVPGYDLSRLRVILNGAEPIDPALLETFNRHFAAAGLAPEAMTPCYGMAEATLAVTFTPVDTVAAVDWVDRGALNDGQVARSAQPWAPGSRGVADCGSPVSGIEVRITRGGVPLADRLVGDVEIRGESVLRSYYGSGTDAVSPDGWYQTGDLGYQVGPALYITGRSKEMLIIGGQNHYPEDIEESVRDTTGIHARRAVAVVLPNDDGRGERACLLAEVSNPRADTAPVVSAVRAAAAAALGGASVDVVLVRRNGLMRTTSGKYQRLLMRHHLQQGTLKHVLAHVRAVPS
jgi:fatty-acyl-CoA synthase